MSNLRRILGLDEYVLDESFGPEQKRPQIRTKIAVGAAVIAGIGIIILAVLSSTFASLGKQSEVPRDLVATSNSQPDQPASPLGAVLIHVIGEVHSPGIYELENGSRVIDAVMAAGGLSPTASDCAVNLARELKDGEQIHIPSTQQGCSTSSGQTGSGPLSINQATAEQFDTLPGIGPTLAERIVEWRESNNGFSSVDQLNDVSGIGDKLFAGIKDLVSL